MKKFFGLKMTLAALAVVSFASCYDSEGSDVIIPNATTITWPDPVYVVNGVVTDYDAGNVMSGVAVSGAITGTTDENGAFSVTLTSPVSGDVDFAKEGYLRATRTLKVASLVKGQGNAIYNMNVAMIAVTSPSILDIYSHKYITYVLVCFLISINPLYCESIFTITSCSSILISYISSVHLTA